MKAFKDLGEFAHFLMLKAAEIEPAISESLRIVADDYYKAVYNTIGDPTKLRPLADTTQVERQRRGFSANEPLLMTGDLRDSIEKEHGFMHSGVGTSNPKMLHHEYGFINIRTGEEVEPRPAFKIALEATETRNLLTIKYAVANTLGLANRVLMTGDVLLDHPLNG